MATIDDARNPSVKIGVGYWRSLCGRRRFPCRDDLTLRGMAAILPYSVIVDVVDGGADYEYRYVGDAQRQAFKTYFKGMRLSQIERAAPELGEVLRHAYELLRTTRSPFLMSGMVDHVAADSQYRFHESAFLPLGAADTAVDHLLIVGVQVPEPFWNIPESKRLDLATQIVKPTAPA